MYKLYLAPDCHDCKQVEAYIDEQSIAMEKVFLATESERESTGIFVFPALFEEGKLIAYGMDILNYIGTSRIE
jgi:glutaredoxin